MQCFHPIVSPVLWCWMTSKFTRCLAHSCLNSQPMISNMQLAAMPHLLTLQCAKCSSWRTAPWSRKITALTSDVPSMRNPNKMFWVTRLERNKRRTSRSRLTSLRFCDGQQRLRKRKQRKHCGTVSPFVEAVKPNTGTALLYDRHAAQHPTVLTTYNPTQRDSHRTISVSIGFETKKSLDDTMHKLHADRISDAL